MSQESVSHTVPSTHGSPSPREARHASVSVSQYAPSRQRLPSQASPAAG